MRAAVRAYVGLGSNLGPSAEIVRAAIERLAALPHTALLTSSSLYRSAPVDANGPDFVNAVIALETQLSAPALLERLLSVEVDFGRERPYPNAPRSLDLDLLLYGQARIVSAHLTIPHPRMSGRAFVLRPLAEIAPDLVPNEWLDATRGQVVTPLIATACAPLRSDTRNTAES